MAVLRALQPVSHLAGPSTYAASRLSRSPAPLAAAAPRGSRRLRQRRQAAAPARASFGLDNFNVNPWDYLKVPRDQTQMMMYPWLEAHQQRERMRHWLQQELCMSDTQARATLSACPALGQLDPRLANRRLRQLDRHMNINRCEAALLVLRHPRTLLPDAADVVTYALEARPPRGGAGGQRPGLS